MALSGCLWGCHPSQWLTLGTISGRVAAEIRAETRDPPETRYKRKQPPCSSLTLGFNKTVFSLHSLTAAKMLAEISVPDRQTLYVFNPKIKVLPISKEKSVTSSPLFLMAGLACTEWRPELKRWMVSRKLDKALLWRSAFSSYFGAVWMPGVFITVAWETFALVTVTSLSSNNILHMLTLHFQYGYIITWHIQVITPRSHFSNLVHHPLQTVLHKVSFICNFKLV